MILQIRIECRHSEFIAHLNLQWILIPDSLLFLPHEFYPMLANACFMHFAWLPLYSCFITCSFFQTGCFTNQEPKAFHKPTLYQLIICARDEAANLAKNLPGALVQQYRTTHEVIVVDDNSYDDSKYLLGRISKTFRQLQVVC